MSTQSSRIYGIKVKEHRNYYEYPHSDDPEIDISEIKIYYDKNATNKWIIKSNYNSIWYNGTAYPVGSIILAFKDGTDCTDKPFMLMAPHEEDGIIVNYFYRITGRFSTVPPVEELTIEQEDVPLEPTVDDSDSIRYTIESGHPNAHYDQLYVRKFVNDVEVGHQIVTAESIRAHQVAHSSNYYNYLKVFNALLFDWNGMLPRIEDSYTFTLYSNVTYLEITPTTYQKGWKIKSWNWDTPVNLNILDFSRQPEPAPVDEHDNIKFNIATNENNPDAINIDKVVNNAVVSTKTYSASDILAYRNSHNNEPIVVYENLLLDFYEETYPGYKFYLRANSNYLKYEDNWIKFGNTITSWGYNDIVNFEINDYSNRYENEIKENTTYNVLVEHIVWRDGYYASVDPPVSLTSDDVCYDIFYDHLEMYYNNHYHKAAWLVYDQPSEGYKRIGKLAIMWAKPFWVLITTADGVRWNGTTYKGRKLLRMWHEDEAVDMTMTREQSRKVIAKGQDYDDILYVITTAESSNDLTVIKRINDLDDDTIVFNPETDCPVDFYNIRFTYSGGKIHVYSKCDFIYLSGSNYKKGRDIIDWPLEEKVNFGIKDETNAYEIINTATYTVKSEEVTVTDYDISTLIDEHWTPLKVCKIVNNKESDDEIIYFYDCSINPFVYDGKLEISYDPASTYWTLTSLSDEIYMDNVQYPEGTVIATWPFGSDEHIYGIGHSDISHYDVRLHSVEVDSSASYETTHEYITDPRYFIVTQSDHSLNLTNDQPGSSPVTRNIRYMDALNWYQFFQIKIKYDVTDSDWIIKSDSNELFIGQDRYKKGEIISKWDYYEDVDSTISVLIEDIKHTTREEKVKDLLVSTKSSWLYGYIWQKEETPPPPVWVYFILAIIQVSELPSRRDYGSLWYINNINVLDLKVKKDLSYYSWQWYRYELFNYKESFLNRIFIQDNYFTDVTQILICDNITDNDPNFIEYTLGSNLRIVGILNKSTIICISKYYYTEETFAYHQYTLFEDGTSRSTYDVENDNEEFIYDIHRTYYDGNIYFNIFGQSGNLLVQTRWSEGQDWKWWLFYPYQNIVETIDNNLTNWNQFIQSISWSNIPVNPQPSDIGSKRSRYEIFSVSDNDNNGGRTEECRQFFYNNKIYMYRKAISVQYELYGYEYYGRWYYSERYVENSETIYYKLSVYDVITGNDYLYDIDPTSLYLDYPAVGDNGYIGYHNYSYHPNEYYRFFGGGYYKWRNLGIYFVARLYGNYNPQSYYTDKYSELNKYGIFKLNEETYDVELVKEIASDSYILINKWNPSTEEFDGQLKFYYFNGILDEETGWIVPIDPDAYSIFRESPNYAEPAIEQVTHIDVNNIPSSMNNGILIRYSTTVSGVSGYYMYIYFDNPYFNASPGNFCMLIHSGNVN